MSRGRVECIGSAGSDGVQRNFPEGGRVVKEGQSCWDDESNLRDNCRATVLIGSHRHTYPSSLPELPIMLLLLPSINVVKQTYPALRAASQHPRGCLCLCFSISG